MLALKNKERNGMNVLKEKLRTKRKIYGFKKAVKKGKSLARSLEKVVKCLPNLPICGGRCIRLLSGENKPIIYVESLVFFYFFSL